MSLSQVQYPNGLLAVRPLWHRFFTLQPTKLDKSPRSPMPLHTPESNPFYQVFDIPKDTASLDPSVRLFLMDL